MADEATGTGDSGTTSTTDTDNAQQQTGGADSAARFTQADLDRIVADRVSRERAKYADYGDLKKKAASAMTDQERAVAEAEQRGATTASAKTATRLARAELKAAAAGQVDPAALDGFLEYADLSKFVGADGEPDDKAIAAAVKQLAGTKAAPDFDGGARTSAGKPINMNQLIRRAAGRA